MHPIGRRAARRLLRSAGESRHRGLQLRVWDLRSAWLSCGIEAVAGVESPPADAPHYDAAYAREHVLEHVLPFWERHSVDRELGGFLTFLTRTGEVWDTAKSPTLQARMVYAFAIGHELDPGGNRLELARHGVDFLLGPGLDHQHGGWHDLLDRQGRPLDYEKPLFTQAYVLFGLAHYARVTGDRQLRDELREAYDLVELHAWDPVHGGYYARCGSDWSTANDCKTICVQLDFMKATDALHQLTGEQRFADRMLELAELIATRMRDPRRGVLLERFSRDWRYDPAPVGDRIELGHSLKAVRWLLEIDSLMGDARYARTAREVLDFSLAHGWDPRFGGFYQHLFRSGRLASPIKEWWPQCEGLWALLLTHRHTGDPEALAYAQRLMHFCFTRFADP